MTDELENRLRDVFAEDAAAAPDGDYLGQGSADAVPNQRWSQFAMGLAAAVVVVAAGVTIFGNPFDSSSPNEVAAVHNPALDHGPDFVGGVSDCVESYSPTAVIRRAFAFDGTVTDTGPGTTNRPGRGHLDTTAVTFDVNEWFHGGSGSTVTIDMLRPSRSISQSIDGEAPPSYEVGTRLLVSGEPRWDGVPLADAIGWGCGFTRYYDEATANAWRTAETG